MSNLARNIRSRSRHTPEQLSETIHFRVSQRTYIALLARSAREGLRPSEFLRFRLHKLLAQQMSQIGEAGHG